VSEEIRRLRDERAAAVTSRGTTSDRLARARAALAEATRRGASDEERAALEREQAQALAALRAVRRDERGTLVAISERVAVLAESPIDRIERLDARYPVAFFPVRIETRFLRGAADDEEEAGELLVRIYPDGVLAQVHEPLLTELEVAAGEAYWRRVFTGTPESDSWTLLLAEADVNRAAWIVERTTPLNTDALGDEPPPEPAFPPQETRPPGWHRPPEAPLLPDRWIVTTYRGGAQRQRLFSEPVREGLALTVRLSADADDAAVDVAVDLSGDGLEIEP
jgi:hypothetical protein